MHRLFNGFYKLSIFFVFFNGLWFSSPSFADSCRNDRDCPRNYECRRSSTGEGVCVWNSNNECRGSGDCPSGSMCVRGTCSDGNPGDSCSHNGHCSTSYVCCSGRCVYSTCRNSLEEDSFEAELFNKSFKRLRANSEEPGESVEIEE